MEKYLVVIAVVAALIVLIAYTQINADSNSKQGTFLGKLKSSFPQYTIIEKFGSYMICEINHRNEPEELVIIRFDENQKKNIRTFGRRVTLTYPKQPSMGEIKKDAAPYLK
ncbi:hypothetical protein G9F32_04390 [Acinetobacter sp. 194]|uniref:hypothetical protein n=1 Tax=Acinetobacter shaoyimingii TaxID=2715164 RepID=UPI00140BD549|nr:hypothetical protein [Acinetobacter shaoyimingii]NHB57272.1 hypothetical protein [Acinetobacter shaoyimingii]